MAIEHLSFCRQRGGTLFDHYTPKSTCQLAPSVLENRCGATASANSDFVVASHDGLTGHQGGGLSILL